MPHRQVFALDLIDDADLIAAYEARHAAGAVWQDVIREIRLRGFLDMEIWRVDDRLVMIAEVADDFPRATDPAFAPTVASWEAAMDEYQKPLHPGAAKWSPMTRIFALTDQ